ncbi:MAG: sigma-E factor negative regulatory protein [Kangiellaceae bacterium]|nr:sigma-E factor negative regulatory protein [Kangiellaceae bacterium]
MFKHKDFHKEQLSALLDSELEQEATHDLLGFEEHDKDAWARYNLIGQVMRNEVSHLDFNIASSVSAALAGEESHLIEESPQDNVISFPQRVWKQVAGYAIAASVAAVALINYSNPSQTDFTPVQFASTQTSSAMSAVTVDTAVSSADRQELQTMHEMFIKHQQLSQRNGNGLPTVQVVSNQKVIPVTVNIPMRAEQPQTDAQSESESSKSAKEEKQLLPNNEN